MKQILIILSIFSIVGCSGNDNSDNNENPNENGFIVNSVFYTTPNYEMGAIVEHPDRAFDIYEFFFTSSNGNFIHLDVNSPNLNEIELMTYPIINEDGRNPGVSLYRKNGFNFPDKDVNYYENISENFKDGFIKVTRENGKLVFEYEFNFFDSTKSIVGSMSE